MGLEPDVCEKTSSGKADETGDGADALPLRSDRRKGQVGGEQQQ